MSKALRKLSHTALVALSLAITACGDDDGNPVLLPDDDNLDTACTVVDENTAVYQIMNEWYYWYEHVPQVEPADYTSPEALLADIRYLPLDETFTYLTTVEAEDAFLSNAAYVGFGFSMVFDESGRVFLRESFEGSPAFEAGMRRGDEITAIDGVTVSTMTDAQFNAALGPNEAGYEATFDVTHADGSMETLTVAKADVETPIVSHVQTDLGDGDTTYIFFRSFVDPAFDALDQAFAEMKAAGDTQLVLDLRYNGGGLISVAEHLGGLIAGVDHAGEILAELDFNAKHQEQNVEYLIGELANSVDVSDLVVITTPSTASASEMIINGLAPLMNVRTVGSTTYGKPVGQSRFEFCETEILRAVTFSVINSQGTSNYFDGFEPYCPATDEISSQLGDMTEDSLSEALYVLANPGAGCSPTSVKAMRTMAKRDAMQPERRALVRDGWDILTGGAR